jgi:molybdopterin synthase catalytic subunit
MIDWCEILATPLPTAAVVAFVQDAGAGGIAVFLGTTRGENSAAGQRLLALDYEVYQDMAGPQLVDLARRARERWPILKLVLLHRTGQVDVGDPSVVIAVSTPHRAAAFEACHWLIDTLKAAASIWKKETWSEGPGTWVDPQSKP